MRLFYKRIALRVQLSVCLWLFGFQTHAQLSEGGKSYSRQIGSASYSYRIDSLGTGVLCGFSWKDSLIGMVYLQKDSLAASFNFNDKKEQGVCELKLVLPTPGSELEQLTATVKTNKQSKRDTILQFTGLIAAWHPQKKLTTAILDSIVYQLTPTTTVVTKPIGTAKNSTSITIYSGSVVIYTASLTQAAPFITYDSDVILGDLKINSGMQFTLQIPSTIQLGSIIMNATYSSLNIPSTTINAVVATWNR